MSEMGWGEFDMIVKINLRPPFANSAIELNHRLKFNPSKSSKKPFLSQSYDEIILHARDIEEWRAKWLKVQAEGPRVLAEINYNNQYLEELLTTLNENKSVDHNEHDDAYLNAIEFVREEIKSKQQEALALQEEIKSKYESSNA